MPNNPIDYCDATVEKTPNPPLGKKFRPKNYIESQYLIRREQKTKNQFYTNTKGVV